MAKKRSEKISAADKEIIMSIESDLQSRNLDEEQLRDILRKTAVQPPKNLDTLDHEKLIEALAQRIYFRELIESVLNKGDEIGQQTIENNKIGKVAGKRANWKKRNIKGVLPGAGRKKAG